jgi:hypothetical protein
MVGDSLMAAAQRHGECFGWCWSNWRRLMFFLEKPTGVLYESVPIEIK